MGYHYKLWGISYLLLGNLLLILAKKCGYESCHPIRNDVLNVHIVAHTHDDVGWIKTVDEYYISSVQKILDTVMEALTINPERRFIYVETAFFWKWWKEQNDITKTLVKDLVNNGRLEFVGGAWSMNDEATTTYQSIIDQFTLGLRKLNDTFGECGRPKIGWQIDPFGHSREMASIFAQLGYDGLILGRIDYVDKLRRLINNSFEFVWDANEGVGRRSNIFTSILYAAYQSPGGYCFDINCSSGKSDTLRRKDIDDKLKTFFAYVDEVASHYTTNNVMIPFGDDFTYEQAKRSFFYLDRLIYYGKKNYGSQYNIMYSTPSCYVKAVHDDALRKKQLWKTYSGDFFPYSSTFSTSWTGFYTSRPTLKRFERVGNNFLQICKQLFCTSNLDQKQESKLSLLQEAMGVMQHHDAITGTEKQYVAENYAYQLSLGIGKCHELASKALSTLITKESPDLADNLTLTSCLLTNISSCDFSEGHKKFLVMIYNPLSRPTNHIVRIPVNATSYTVKNHNGTLKTVDLIPIPAFVRNIPGRKSVAKYELIFEAINVPPLGFESFYVEEKTGNDVLTPRKNIFVHKYKDFVLTRNRATGLVSSVTLNDTTISLNQQYMIYRGFTNFTGQKSGAYIFRPMHEEAERIAASARSTVYEGSIVTEIQQSFNNWVSQTVRLYRAERFIEFDWVIGPLPEKDTIDVISRFTTNLSTQASFYTDSNGRQMLKRSREGTSPPRNYYPVTAIIMGKDGSRNSIAILTDRAEGGSSLEEGQLELMVHRQSMKDDGKGVGEALNERAFGKGLVVRGSHYVIVGKRNTIAIGKQKLEKVSFILLLNQIGKSSLADYEHEMVQKNLLPPWIFFYSMGNLTFEMHRKKCSMLFSGLKRSLPTNVNILTLEPWKKNSIILRLEYTPSKANVKLSVPVDVDLKGLFSQFEILSFRETTLGGNQWLKDNVRLKFSSQRPSREEKVKHTNNSFVVSLEPMQIRTFIINTKYH